MGKNGSVGDYRRIWKCRQVWLPKCDHEQRWRKKLFLCVAFISENQEPCIRWEKRQGQANMCRHVCNYSSLHLISKTVREAGPLLHFCLSADPRVTENNRLENHPRGQKQTPFIVWISICAICPWLDFRTAMDQWLALCLPFFSGSVYGSNPVLLTISCWVWCLILCF